MHVSWHAVQHLPTMSATYGHQWYPVRSTQGFADICLPREILRRKALAELSTPVFVPSSCDVGSPRSISFVVLVIARMFDIDYWASFSDTLLSQYIAIFCCKAAKRGRIPHPSRGSGGMLTKLRSNLMNKPMPKRAGHAAVQCACVHNTSMSGMLQVW